MNFYKFYPGDFQRDTAHLSLIERGAFRAMLDFFYSTEKPLPTGDALYRIVGAVSKGERLAVDRIAADFWVPHPDGGILNPRALREMGKADAIAARNREVGKAGGRPKAKPKNNPEITQTVSKTEPKPEPRPNPNPNPEKPNAHINQTPDINTSLSQTTIEIQPVSHAQPAAASSSVREADLQRGNEIARLLCQLGAKLKPEEPQVLQWAAEGFTDADILRAFATAKAQRGPSAQPIGVNLLNAILRSQAATAAIRPGKQFDPVSFVNGGRDAREIVINP